MLTDIFAFYSGHIGLFVGSVFAFGLVIGSFLNVVIYRLPIILERDWQAQAREFVTPAVSGTFNSELPASERFTLSSPRSACPNCKTPINAWQNIPVVSWILLHGRCASCKQSISPRYPLVEIATGMLSAAVAWRFGPGSAVVCGLIMTWVLIALTGIDMDHQLLPDNLTLSLMWSGLLVSVARAATDGQPLPVSPQSAIVGAAAGYISLWLVFQLFRLVTGKDGMGYGDFKLFAALGAWLGWQLLPLVILLAAAAGAILGIMMIWVQGRDRAAPIPFGPFLAAAGWIAMMYGESMVSGYLKLSGLQL